MKILPIALALALIPASAASAVTRGEPVPESRYPWLADMLGCGGTLIAPDRVLTAAHCLLPMEGFEEITLSVGEGFERGQRIKVRRHARDPRFEGLKSELMARYDIAVLELAEPVKGIEPLALAERDPLPGTPATIVGRGRTRFFGLDPEDTPARFRTRERTLTEGRQKILADGACRRYYATNRYKRDFFDSADMICSLDPRRRKSRAAGAPWTSVCLGDSGGPLIAGGKLVGVTSWSEWCGLRHDPSVFARVSRLRDFIANPVWAPVAVTPPSVSVDGTRMTCAAPAFEGPAEVTGAIWSVVGSRGQLEPIPDATATAFDGVPGRSYACAIRARNAGGSARTPASAVVSLP